MDREGRPTVKRLRYDPNALLSSANNPPLRNGDVVVVDRNTFTKVTDTMTDAMLTFEPVVDAVSVYRLLGLPAPTSGGR
jgi:polysaccharide export outer membrane protein